MHQRHSNAEPDFFLVRPTGGRLDVAKRQLRMLGQTRKRVRTNRSTIRLNPSELGSFSTWRTAWPSVLRTVACRAQEYVAEPSVATQLATLRCHHPCSSSQSRGGPRLLEVGFSVSSGWSEGRRHGGSRHAEQNETDPPRSTLL